MGLSGGRTLVQMPSILFVLKYEPRLAAPFTENIAALTLASAGLHVFECECGVRPLRALRLLH
jgi:hypothetical protein